MLLLVNGHVQILPQQMVKGNVWFKEAIYTDDQCIWYFMIRILNDLHWKERVTWSATIWFVLWDLIHECNKSRFPLFKKHATKQDKHAQLTSKGDVGAFLLFKCVLPKLTFKKTNYSRNLTKNVSWWAYFVYLQITPKCWKFITCLTSQRTLLFVQYSLRYKPFLIIRR